MYFPDKQQQGGGGYQGESGDQSNEKCNDTQGYYQLQLDLECRSELTGQKRAEKFFVANASNMCNMHVTFKYGKL